MSKVNKINVMLLDDFKEGQDLIHVLSEETDLNGEVVQRNTSEQSSIDGAIFDYSYYESLGCRVYAVTMNGYDILDAFKHKYKAEIKQAKI